MHFKSCLVAALAASVRASESGVEEQASLQSSTLSGGDYFGGAVAAASGTVVVSAYLDGTGSVYTFEKNKFDAWAETNHWTNPTGSTYEGFGSAVAISNSPALGNDVAAVGSSNELGTGAVFIYRRTAKGSEAYTYYQWDYVQRLVVDDLKTGDKFGAAVALDGDTLLVGCTFGDGSDTVDSGRAFIFTVNKATGKFEFHQELPRSTSDNHLENENDYFGHSVSLSKNTAIVGAHNSDALGTNSGAAFVYVRNSEGTWSFQAELVSGETAKYDYFGFSVAVSGEYALIGAFGVDSNPNDGDDKDGVMQSGAAYLFKRSGSKWSLKQKMVKMDPDDSDQFGASVALGNDGATALVSARHDMNVGSVYLYVASGDDLLYKANIFASDGRDGDFFGFSTALDDTTGIAVVGAPLKGETDNASNSGGAYVYQVPLGAHSISGHGLSAGSVAAIVLSVLFVVFSALYIFEMMRRGEDPFGACKNVVAKLSRDQSDGNAASKYVNMGPETTSKAELL